MAEFDKFSVLDPLKLRRDASASDKGVPVDKFSIAADPDKLYQQVAAIAAHKDGGPFDKWAYLDPQRAVTLMFALYD